MKNETVSVSGQWQQCPLCSTPAETGYSVDLDAWIIGCMHCTAYGLSHGAISVLAENPQLRASLSSAVRQGVALVLITEANVFKIAARSNAALRPEFALAT